MKGGGLVLWIMVSPGRGNKERKAIVQKISIEKKGGFHGKDHPGNQ
jgi:hypothetical protein